MPISKVIQAALKGSMKGKGRSPHGANVNTRSMKERKAPSLKHRRAPKGEFERLNPGARPAGKNPFISASESNAKAKKRKAKVAAAKVATVGAAAGAVAVAARKNKR